MSGTEAVMATAEEIQAVIDLVSIRDGIEYVTRDEVLAVAHTAAVLGEQRAAVLARHFDMGNSECAECSDALGHRPYPCPTARALGVVR